MFQLVVPAVLLVTLFSEPFPSNGTELMLASSSVVFCRKREKSLVIKATELRISYTAGPFRAPKLGQNTSHSQPLETTVVLSVTSFIFVLLIV